ncbi:MAG: hypothetical protein ACE5J7_01615 [Candidatus Aenigmatarchaeota archaeon]
MKIWEIRFEGLTGEEERFLEEFYEKLNFLEVKETGREIKVNIVRDVHEGERKFCYGTESDTKIPGWERKELKDGVIFKTKTPLFAEVRPYSVTVYGRPDKNHLRMSVIDILHNLAYSHVFVHASSVSNGKTSTLILGRSGSGKTRTMLEMLKKGYILLSEDFSVLDREMKIAYPFNTYSAVSLNDIEKFGMEYDFITTCNKGMVHLEKYFKTDKFPREIGDVVSLDGTNLEDSIIEYRNWAGEIFYEE